MRTLRFASLRGGYPHSTAAKRQSVAGEQLYAVTDHFRTRDRRGARTLKQMRRFLAIIISAIASPIIAQTILPGPPPPAAVDWFARVTSLIAILIGLGGLGLNLLSRRDKARDREPAVDLDLTKSGTLADYNFELKILNRAEVSIQIVSLRCRNGALEPDDANVSKDGSTVDYNSLRVERGKDEVLVGVYRCEYSFAGPEEFTITVRINDHRQQMLTRKLIRELP